MAGLSESDRKERAVLNLLRLRRIDKLIPFNDDVAQLREGLAKDAGEAVSQRSAARLLGVSHPALSRWVNSGHVPLVSTSSGRSQVPVEALLELLESAEQLRDSEDAGGRPLEPLMRDFKRKSPSTAKRATQPQISVEEAKEEVTRVLSMRELAYHRALARNLDRATIDHARERLEERRANGTISEADAEEWEAVLKKTVSDVAAVMTENTPRGKELRKCSPFDRRAG